MLGNFKHTVWYMRCTIAARYLSHLLGVARIRGALATLSFSGHAFVQELLLFMAIFFAFTGAGLVSVAAHPALAFAEETGQLTIVSPDETSRNYAAYRLLAGPVQGNMLQSPNTAGCVPQSVWEALGAPSTQADELTTWLATRLAADADSSFAMDLRDAIYAANATPQARFATGETVQLPEGYYLVASGNARPLITLVSASGPTTVTEKSTTPTVQKEVQDPANGDWGNAAALGVGKPVPFRAVGTLPSDLSVYNSYMYWFLDTPGKGLAIDASSVVAEVLHANGTKTPIELEVVEEEGTLRMGSNDIMQILPTLAHDDHIIVEYVSYITPEALRSGEAENTIELIYTSEADINKEGRSVPSIVRMYSFTLDIVKVEAGTTTPLPGAQFTLQDEAGVYFSSNDTWMETADESCIFTTDSTGHVVLDGLSAGTYTLTEVAAPAGFTAPKNPYKVEISPAVIAEDGSIESFSATITGTGAQVTGLDAATLVAKVAVENPKVETPNPDPNPDPEPNPDPNPEPNPNPPSGDTPTTPGQQVTSRTGVLTGDTTTDILLAIAVAVVAGTVAAFASTRKNRKQDHPPDG